MSNERNAAAAVNQALGAASLTLAKSNEQFSEQLSALAEAQRGFHTSLQSSADEAAAILRGHVEDLEKQVGRWLTDYAQNVDRQIVDRMGLWNTHSQEYANQMLNVAGALQEVLEQIDAKAGDAAEVKASA